MAGSGIIIGNSDGIGLGLTKRLLAENWQVVGLSRSKSPVEHEHYRQLVVDVSGDHYQSELRALLVPSPDLVVYCPGIGEAFDPAAMAVDTQTFEVNLIVAVKTIETVLPVLHANRRGHIVVLSSLADVLISNEAPAYAGSKAGLSTYVESIALAMKPHGVAITNVRFGFVDTKMAKGEKQPMKMSVAKAVDHLMTCIRTRPVRYSRPRLMATLVSIAGWLGRIKVRLS